MSSKYPCESAVHAQFGEPESRASVPDPTADTARALANLHADAERERTRWHAKGTDYERWESNCRVRIAAIEDAARACGPQVLSAFRAMVTGDAGREVDHA